MKRPENDRTADGRKIVYPIWRKDLGEALILPKEPEVASTELPKATDAGNAAESR